MDYVTASGIEAPYARPRHFDARTQVFSVERRPTVGMACGSPRLFGDHASQRGEEGWRVAWAGAAGWARLNRGRAFPAGRRAS